MEQISEEIPECYGTGTPSALCENCIYKESCYFCAEDNKRVKMQDSKWFQATEYMDNFNHSPEHDLPVDISENRTYSRDEVIALSAFLLRIGDRTSYS